MATSTIVVVFLRGGADGLSLVSPTGDQDYIAARPEGLRVLRKGDGVGHAMDNPAADVDFRFHPMAKGFSELYDAKQMAVIHASGLTDGTRSHFDAEDRMERAARKLGSGGWLGRCLRAANPEGILPALAVSGNAPESIRGSVDVAVAESLEQLILAGGGELAPLLKDRLRSGFGRHSTLQAPVERLIALNDILSTRLFDKQSGSFLAYEPSVDYPEVYLSTQFKTIAQSIKLGLGLRVATVDYGGWDTHEDQQYDLGGVIEELSDTLLAFWRDLGDAAENVTVVIMSEFGRRLRSNTTGGTDHGFGNVMMVLGGQVRGGRMLGEWPGLANEALDDGADLAITTDYRHVLAEILATQAPDFDPSIAFPEFTPEPRGIFS